MSSTVYRQDLSPAPGQCVRIRLGRHTRGGRSGEIVLEVDPAKLGDNARRALKTKGGYSRLAGGGFIFRALDIQEVRDA